MDADASKVLNNDKRNISNVSNVLLAIWLRCIVQIHYGYNWFVLDRRYRFLFYFGIFLYMLLFVKELFKQTN
jgi:hypothetical protein